MAHSCLLIYSKHLHGMGQVQPIFPSRNKADFCAGLSQNALIHPIGAGKCLYRAPLVVNDPGLLCLWRVYKADIQAPFGHVELRRDKLQSQRIAIDYRCHFNRVFNAFQTGPNPGETRQRKSK